MSYANMFELDSCLEDAIAYCEKHPDREHSKVHHFLLKSAQKELDSAVKASDEHFASWRAEYRDDKLAWKHLSTELRDTQNELRRVGAAGYFDQKVLYWNTDLLAGAVLEMLEYLRDRVGDLDFAQKRIDALQRRLDGATSDDFETRRSLKGYLRHSQVRSDAMKNAVNTIASFRKAVRKDLGKTNQEYQSLRWPQAIASDEAVL